MDNSLSELNGSGRPGCLSAFGQITSKQVAVGTIIQENKGYWDKMQLGPCLWDKMQLGHFAFRTKCSWNFWSLGQISGFSDNIGTKGSGTKCRWDNSPRDSHLWDNSPRDNPLGTIMTNLFNLVLANLFKSNCELIFWQKLKLLFLAFLNILVNQGQTYITLRQI